MAIKKKFLVFICLSSVIILYSCSSSPRHHSDYTVTKNGANRPTTAIDKKSGNIYVAWVGTNEGETNVYLSRLVPDSQKFAKPLKINKKPGNIAQEGQSPAQVRVSPKGTVYVTWIRQKKVKELRYPAGDVRLARSTDGGKTFSPAITVNHPTSKPTGQSFEDMAIGPNGTIYVSWLDARAIDKAMRKHEKHTSESGGSSDNHQSGHKADMKRGAMQMDNMQMEGMEKADMKMQIRVSHSTDGGKHFSKGTVVSTSTCQCCRTAIAVGPKGTVYAAWRQIYGGLKNQVRDIAIARSTDGGQTFTKPKRVHTDNWHIRACPHAGPALAVDSKGRVHILWYTGAEGKSGVYYAVSKGGGAPFKSVKKLVKDVGRSQAAAAGNEQGAVWIAWADHNADGIRAGLASNGKLNKSVKESSGSTPAVAVGNRRKILVWNDNGAVKAQVNKIFAAR
jgi:hypothetical protein